MAGLPEIGSSQDQYLTWVEQSCDAVSEPRGSDEEQRTSFEEFRDEVLDAFGVDEGTVQSDPQCAVLREVMRYVEDNLGGEDMWAFMKDAGQRDPEVRKAYVRSLTWVTPERQITLEAWEPMWGDWRGWLPQQLSASEGDGLEWDGDALDAWLDAYLSSLVTSLAWVTDNQQATLQGWEQFRGDWREWLPQQLTQWWPEWTLATPDALIQTLDDWLPTLITNLAWITADQQTQLGAGWFDQIRGKLDEAWPDWYAQTDPMVLSQWLSEAWDALFAATDEAVPAETADGTSADVAAEPAAGESTAEQAVAELARVSLEELTGQVWQAKPDLAQEISDEQLREFLAGLLQERLAAQAG